MLSSDFVIKSNAKLQLLQQAAKLQEAVPIVVLEPLGAAVELAPPVAEAKVEEAPEVDVSGDSVVVNEKLVKLTELGGRKTVLKDAPSSLDAVASEEDLPKFSLEALKKLAKSAGLEHSKQINKSALVALLVDAHRKGRTEVRDALEEAAEAACLR